MALRDSSIRHGRPRLEGQRIARLLLLAGGLAACVAFVLSFHLLPSRYELHEGDVTPSNIRAAKRVQYVSAIETKAERERAASSVQEVYVFDAGVASQQRARLVAALQSASTVRTNSALSPDAKKASFQKALEVDLPDADLALMAGMDESRWQSVVANAPRVLYELLSEKVPAERLRGLRGEALARLGAISVDQDRALAADLVQQFARDRKSVV